MHFCNSNGIMPLIENHTEDKPRCKTCASAFFYIGRKVIHMQIKIFNQNQLSMLRNINPLLKEYKIPRMVLHEIGYILEFEKASDNDYVTLFLNHLRNDLIEILDRLHLYTEEVEYSENNFHAIEVKGKKHTMKKKRIWSWYDISIPAQDRTIFVVYSMKKKDLKRKGGLLIHEN